MNDLPIPRLMAATVAEALARFPVVVLTGARQTGKTTLVRMAPLAEGRQYLSLDDWDTEERAAADPAALLDLAPRLTIDEVQRAPDLLRTIKLAVDQRREKGRFLLTGSANLLMMRRVSETLAGRAVYLHLWPMTQAERAARTPAVSWSALLEARGRPDAQALMTPAEPFRDWPERVLAGGYPSAVLASDAAERAAWFEGYLRTYLERDLLEVAALPTLADFRRLMRVAALHTGQVTNQSQLARDVGLSQPTVHRHLNLLETSFQIARVPAYAVSRTKRVVKSPKLYWTDTGLAAHLAGLSDSEAVREGHRSGALLEGLVLAELLAWRETVVPRPEICFWRTHSGEEVDFVIEAGRRLLPIEVKAASRVRVHDARGLELFLQEHAPHARLGLLLYTGGATLPLTEHVLAVPLAAVL